MFRDITFGTTPICARLSENLNRINNKKVSRKVSNYIFRHQKTVSEIYSSFLHGAMSASAAEGLLKLVRNNIIQTVNRFGIMNTSQEPDVYTYETFIGNAIRNILLTNIKITIAQLKTK